jgi:hypothetical protein
MTRRADRKLSNKVRDERARDRARGDVRIPPRRWEFIVTHKFTCFVYTHLIVQIMSFSKTLIVFETSLIVQKGTTVTAQFGLGSDFAA